MRRNSVVGMLVMIGLLLGHFNVAHATVAQLSEKQFSRDIQWNEPDEGEQALEGLSLCDPPPDCTETAGNGDFTMLGLYGFVDPEAMYDLEAEIK